jgi:hypothetical protein
MRVAPAFTLSLSNNTADVARDTIARFASALRASAHHVTATNPLGQRLWERWWPITVLIEASDWLSLEAKGGRTITMRPWCTSRLLVRGLRPTAYARLAAEHRVAAAVEVGGTIEAWISLGDRSVDARVAARTSAILAARYAGDLLSAGACARGHLPLIPLPGAAGTPESSVVPTLLTATAQTCPAAAAIAVDAAAAIGCDVLWTPKPAPRPGAGHRPERTQPRRQRATDRDREGATIR